MWVATLALLTEPEWVTAGPGGWRLSTVSDTDSVAVPLPDTLLAPVAGDSAAVSDSTAALDSSAVAAADSVAADTTERARTYFQVPFDIGTSASVLDRRLPGVRGRLGSYWQRQVTLDSTDLTYRITERLGSDERVPAELTLDQFLRARRQQAINEQFRTLVAQRASRREQRQGGGGVRFDVEIPGGQNSAFTTIFGKNEVALTVNGTSNVNLGVRYDRNDRQENLSPGGNPFAPDFGQDLNLNVAGTIGDKLAINVNYDTQSQFDFENQVSLVYTGYEDDIIQRIEAGNVFLQTPATLIRGGQRLFGLRTDLQFGPLALTAVASQQDAETVESVFEGGADAQQFSFSPFEYEDNTHFFLGYAFHNWWNRGHERPSNPIRPPGLRRFIGIEVWKHEPSLISALTDETETTWAVALADLGEPAEVLDGGEAYLGTFDSGTGRYNNENDQPGGALLPSPGEDQYADALLNTIRADGSSVTVETVNADPGVERQLPQAGA
ncbi:MAG: cell surface protein SprA, partial [Bacteroidota bacterium]